MQKLLVIAVLLVPMHTLTLFAADKVTPSFIVQKWRDTKVESLHCKVLHIQTQQDVERKSNAEFWRNAEFGTRVRDQRTDSWVVDDIAHTIHFDSSEGFSSVLISSFEGSGVDFSEVRWPIWTWIEPENVPRLSQHLKQLEQLDNSEINVIDDEVHGRIANISIPDGKRVVTWSLSEKYDWRVFQQVFLTPGHPDIHYRWNYARNASSQLVLTSFSSIRTVGLMVGPGQPVTTVRMSISDVAFDCRRESLIGQIPVKSFVEDRTVQPPANYILREDGTKRPFDAKERAKAGTWQRLHDTNVGDLLK